MDKARKAAEQLIDMRAYMAHLVLNVKITNPHMSRWMAAPAYLDRNVAKMFTEHSGFYIKQISLKYRNPLNKPNENERRILHIIEKTKQKNNGKLVKTTRVKKLLDMQNPFLSNWFV